MDCFPDFCLACDKQTTDGLYCSQACRMADLERAGSAPESPITPLSFSFSSVSWTPAHHGPQSGFFLPPAVDFGSFKNVSSTSPLYTTQHNDQTRHQSLDACSPRRSSPSHTHMASNPATPHRLLSPSSSRSSLASGLSGLTITQSSDGLSEQAKTELRDYCNAFDQTREWRRRSNPCPKQSFAAFKDLETYRSYRSRLTEDN